MYRLDLSAREIVLNVENLHEKRDSWSEQISERVGARNFNTCCVRILISVR